MAIVSKSPARGRASIPEAPAGSYEAVASKYAQEFMQAARQQKANELSMKVIQYQKGEISYDELKKYLNERIDGSKENSSERVELMQTLSQVEEYHDKLKELDNQERVSKRRSELIDEYKDRGLDNQEQLKIVRELRDVADKDSEIYRQLIAEEAKILGAIENEKTQGSGQAASSALNQTITSIETAEQQAEFAYQRGEITGLVRDQIRLQHAQELAQAVSQAQAQGMNVSREVLDMAQNFAFGSEEMINLRQSGIMADVVGEDGMVKRIATNTNNFGQEIKFSPSSGLQMGTLADIGNIRQDALSGMFYVFDPATGRETPFKSQSAAMDFAEQNGLLTFNILLPDPNNQIEMQDSITGEITTIPSTRRVEMARDSRTGVFYEVANPTNAYAVLPQNAEQLESYKIGGLPDGWQSDEEIANQVVGMVNKIRGGEENIDLNITLPQVDEAQPEERGFFEKIKDFFGGFGQTDQELGNFSLGGESIAGGGGGGGADGGSDSRFREFIGNAGQAIMDVFKPSPVQASGPMVQPKGLDRQSLLGDFKMPKVADFKMPEINLPDFQMPDFKMPDFNVNMPSFGNQSQSSFSQATQPIVSNIKTGVQNIGSKIKDFGQNLFTGVKNFFGF